MASNHPLPAASGQNQYQNQYQNQQRPGQQRPRTKSTFSFRSNHSHKSSNSSNKVDLHETHQEKEAKRLQTKADPSMAITEAEPSAVASGEKSLLGSIRAIQHRDALGNPIGKSFFPQLHSDLVANTILPAADPDRSNPTRSRWERPLDTIRSFEAAIDGNYSRKSYMRTAESDVGSQYNRRSSYFGGTQVTQDDRSRYQSGYNGRSQSYRPESTYMNGRESYHNDNNGGPSNGYYPNRARYPRTASEPHFNNGQNIYPMPGNHQSYETVTTASGSGSSGDPVGYNTDPSSENSSDDRINALPNKEPAETYGFNGFGNTPQFVPPGAGMNEQYGGNGQQKQNGYSNQRPPPPRKDVPRNGGPIRLGETSGNAGPPPAQRPAAAEKRKSWFSKRFSKS
ncbi:hypothetical protein B0J14DRAFT_652343 [Halenospora varia]|nr:hypothetical protein B0J14DRAFT_652343 [Halenospora varia]